SEADGHPTESPARAQLEPFDDEPFEDEPFETSPIDGDLEVPLGTRRASHRERLRTQGRRRDRAPATRRRRRTPGPGRRARMPGSGGHPWAGRTLSVLAIALGVAAIWFVVELFQPFHGSGQDTITVTIAPHSAASQIGTELERDGVISSGFFFNLRAMLAGDRSSLLAGTYKLRRDMSYGDVLRVLTTPPLAAKTTNVTLIEGRTRRQIDRLLRSQGVRGSYLSQTRRSPLLDPRRYGAPAGTPSLEGFLFPSTYQLIEPIHISALIADQLRTFRQVFSHVDLRYAKSRHMSAYDVLIIASMVQAEAATSRDGPLVASVIYNRLAAGMPLQIDATTRYATGNYTRPLTVSELSSSSPYNTRLRPGLTPTPIDNPGLAAIKAAAHPASTNYLYFVVKPCGNGSQVFTASYAKFLNYVAQYQAARARNGGRSPAHC
ncbi:MAG: endolytic transglycosylase MltG, partial [Actinomycetota bacterium]|nr:endolytic transglycosylase MltG [Actinomycetota bacterium]